MAKKQKVWLNNTIPLHCTVVIRFYHIFVTDRVSIHFLCFKAPKPFWISKEWKGKSRFKNSGNSLGEVRGSSKTPWNGKSLGGGCKAKSLPWWGYGYFLEPHNVHGSTGSLKLNECFYSNVPRIFWSLYVLGKLPTYPSLKPKFCLNWEGSVLLRGGVGGEFPRNV